jgi:hypothetical protein
MPDSSRLTISGSHLDRLMFLNKDDFAIEVWKSRYRRMQYCIIFYIGIMRVRDGNIQDVTHTNALSRP